MYTSDAFFLLDVLFNFRLAYHEPYTRELVIDQRVIATRYMKFAFWIDLAGEK